jgi:hypothetical protein
MSVIGVGIITCDRENLFKECASSLPSTDFSVVVNDGNPYPFRLYPSNIQEIIQHRHNRGVGRSKNDALRFLMSKNCEHIFLLEDDIKIINKSVFDEYIRASTESGIRHLNFAYHGPANKDKDGFPKEKIRINFQNDVSLSFHSHLAGAFSYYHSSIINKVGYIDEKFMNVYDHLDHTLQMIKSNLHPPFGWFADLADSYKYIEDLDPDLSKSVIRKKILRFRLRYKLYSFLFKHKNKFTVENYPRGTGEDLFDYLRNYTSFKKINQ